MFSNRFSRMILMKIEEIKEYMKRYLSLPKNKAKILMIDNNWPYQQSFYLDLEDLQEFNTDISAELQQHPSEVIWASEEILYDLSQPDCKHEIKLRIMNCSKNTDAHRNIRDIRSEDMGKLISVPGLIKKATQVKPKIMDAVFQCSRCLAVLNEPQDNNVLKEPVECYKDQGGCGKAASNTRFILLSEDLKNPLKMNGNVVFPDKTSTFIDTQKLELQEIPEDIRGREQPEKIVAIAEEDQCKVCTAGDKVVLNGILRSKPKGTITSKAVVFDWYLEVSSIEMDEHDYSDIEITPEEEIRIKEISKLPNLYNTFVSSLAPSIYGLRIEKEAIVLQMFGGITKQLKDGNRLRGDIHILLIGDPGLAKSQLLRYVCNSVPRGIFASGKQTTGAGLVAAAVHDDEFAEGRWTLEAGALVLGDKGFVVIDELDKMKDGDRGSLNEAMENQKVSINKAGLNVTLQCRCSILAAANPDGGRWDTTKYIFEQINMDPTLLSRFDAIFPLVDIPDLAYDKELANHILNVHGNRNVDDCLTPPISQETMRKYIAYAKANIVPVMTDSVRELLRDYYVKIRNSNKGANANSVPLTPRQMEALIRLSEASARGRLSNEVKDEDGLRAIKILEHYLKAVASEGGRIDIDAVLTGSTAIQRDRLDIIKGIVRERGEITEEELLQECVHLGFNVEKTQRDIERLKSNGSFYEPKNGSLKLMKGLY